MPTLSDQNLMDLSEYGLRTGDKVSFGMGASAVNSGVSVCIFSDGTNILSYKNTGHILASGFHAVNYYYNFDSTHKMAPRQHYDSDNPPVGYQPREAWTAHGGSEGTVTSGTWTWQHITYPNDWSTTNEADFKQLVDDIEAGNPPYHIWPQGATSPNTTPIYLNRLHQRKTPFYEPLNSTRLGRLT